MLAWGKSLWVVAFCFITLFIYIQAFKEKGCQMKQLQSRLKEMEMEKAKGVQQREDLRLRLASQCDPAWIEMVLMRDLGVVPEGFLKVHFKE